MDDIILIEKPITNSELKPIAEKRFGDMVKAVVDIEKNIMAIGGGMHADEEAFLLEQGSLQQNLWGINIYPNLEMPNMIEFDSMINIRPNQNNRSRNVEDEIIRKKILEIVTILIV
jgi:hypothetical protein